MNEILEQLDEWLHAHPPRPCVLATVVETSASAPRPAGTQMAIGPDGTVVGSLSGGCIEADVVARAEEVAATGRPHLQDYGYSDDNAWAVGLTCGGTIRVLLEHLDAEDAGLIRRLASHVRNGHPVALATTSRTRRLVEPDDGTDAFTALLHEGRSGPVTVDGVEYLLCSYPAPEHMIIFGSNAFAAALCRLATHVGYRVTVCDARPLFTTRERFPDAHHLVVDRPDSYLAQTDIDDRTVLCAMTHDPKFDDPLLAAALATPARFIGAMGSRQVTGRRRQRLREQGLDDSRLHAPVGLDLGALSPAETAVSILAEIIAARRGATARPLTQTTGPIHRRQ